MAGWIKLHRKLLENPIMTKPELLQLFIYCLLKANHEPKKIIFNGKETIIDRGQFITGRDVLSKELKQNGRTTYDRLKILENLKIINIKTNNKFSLVTVINYSFYQMVDEESNNESNNQPTTSQQPANTNKNDKNDKNDKNINNIVSIDTIPYKEIVDLFNSICISLSKVTALTKTRKQKLKLRWHEWKSFDNVEKLFQQTESTDFLKGDNNRNWKATFDWLIANDTNYTKVLEGVYKKKQYDPTANW